MSFMMKDGSTNFEETKKIQLLEQTLKNNSKLFESHSEEILKVEQSSTADRFIPQRVHSNNQSIFEISSEFMKENLKMDKKNTFKISQGIFQERETLNERGLTTYHLRDVAHDMASEGPS